MITFNDDDDEEEEEEEEEEEDNSPFHIVFFSILCVSKILNFKMESIIVVIESTFILNMFY